MTLHVEISDHPDRPDWSCSPQKGGVHEDLLTPTEWRAYGKLLDWFFNNGSRLTPNTVRKTYEFELDLRYGWFYGNEKVIAF